MNLNDLKKQVNNCTNCLLHETKKNYVFGSGDEKAKIMFIAEAPGAQENIKGVPFVGRAGGILDELLSSINIERGDIYLTNCLKCRPPENRNPRPIEIERCKPYLDKQIDIIQPKIICTLGNFATEFIFKKYGIETEKKGISKHHGKVYKVQTLTGTKTILPLYHPAVATYNPEMKSVLLKDMKVIKHELASD